MYYLPSGHYRAKVTNTTLNNMVYCPRNAHKECVWTHAARPTAHRYVQYIGGLTHHLVSSYGKALPGNQVD